MLGMIQTLRYSHQTRAHQNIVTGWCSFIPGWLLSGYQEISESKQENRSEEAQKQFQIYQNWYITSIQQQHLGAFPEEKSHAAVTVALWCGLWVQEPSSMMLLVSNYWNLHTWTCLKIYQTHWIQQLGSRSQTGNWTGMVNGKNDAGRQGNHGWCPSAPEDPLLLRQHRMGTSHPAPARRGVTQSGNSKTNRKDSWNSKRKGTYDPICKVQLSSASPSLTQFNWGPFLQRNYSAEKAQPKRERKGSGWVHCWRGTFISSWLFKRFAVHG